jgi:hypothetical protein
MVGPPQSIVSQMINVELLSRACEMADEFPHAQVIGVDVAPIQPEYARLHYLPVSH